VKIDNAAVDTVLGHVQESAYAHGAQEAEVCCGPPPARADEITVAARSSASC
jgi:hypothetical protein